MLPSIMMQSPYPAMMQHQDHNDRSFKAYTQAHTQPTSMPGNYYSVSMPYPNVSYTMTHAEDTTTMAPSASVGNHYMHMPSDKGDHSQMQTHHPDDSDLLMDLSMGGSGAGDNSSDGSSLASPTSSTTSNNHGNQAMTQDMLASCASDRLQDFEDNFKIANKKRGSSVPDEMKDGTYWEKRKKNNDSARRSREARRMKEEQIALRVVFMEQENLQLRTEVSLLRGEIEKLRCMLYNS